MTYLYDIQFNISICHLAVVFRFKKNSSDEDGGNIEELKFADLEPFMASFHTYKKDTLQAETWNEQPQKKSSYDRSSSKCVIMILKLVKWKEKFSLKKQR